MIRSWGGQGYIGAGLFNPKDFVESSHVTSQPQRAKLARMPNWEEGNHKIISRIFQFHLIAQSSSMRGALPQLTTADSLVSDHECAEAWRSCEDLVHVTQE